MQLTRIRDAAGRAGNRIHSLTYAVAGALLAGVVGLLVTSVMMREWLGIGSPWIEDLTRWCLLWTVLLGLAVASRDNEHISMEALHDRLPPRGRRWLTRMHVLAGLAIAAVLLFLGIRNTERVIRLEQMSRSGDLPGWIGYGAIPVGAGLTVLACLTFLIASGRSTTRETDMITTPSPGDTTTADVAHQHNPDSPAVSTATEQSLDRGHS